MLCNCNGLCVILTESSECFIVVWLCLCMSLTVLVIPLPTVKGKVTPTCPESFRN